MKLTDAQIKHMVDRFLGWKLPDNFTPDCGISFDPISNRGNQFESKRAPVGTNLFDADQARQMVSYMLEGLPPSNNEPVCEDGTPHIFRQRVVGQTTKGVIGLPIKEVRCTKCDCKPQGDET